MTSDGNGAGGSVGGWLKWLGASLGVVVIAGVVYYVFPSASNKGYQPEQPIPFSHKLHAGQYKMQCLYCHGSAEKSQHASVPGLNVCMNCHRVVKTNSPYIQQLTKAYNEGRPIEWVRIHELPDHAYFPHHRHVAKGIACQTCHGPIQEMERVYQSEALTMGWCLNCHNGKSAPRHVLEATYPDQTRATGEVPQGPVAPNQCTTCHH